MRQGQKDSMAVFSRIPEGRKPGEDWDAAWAHWPHTWLSEAPQQLSAPSRRCCQATSSPYGSMQVTT